MGASAILLPSLPAYSSHLSNQRPFPPSRTQSLQLRTRPCITKAVNDDNKIPMPSPPPDAVEIRFRRGSRKRAKLQEDNSFGSQKPPSPPKDWESMTLGEKAVELYMGEKGLLFWLNKFAYASIFIIIGGWILFRFVGPSVGFYQLDTPPLAPTSIFSGS